MNGCQWTELLCDIYTLQIELDMAQTSQDEEELAVN